MISFQFLKLYVTSSSVMSVDTVGCFFTILGIANNARNSLGMSSFPYYCGGIVPSSSSAESLDRLLKESPLCMIPFPHGDAAAALKEPLLQQSRLHSMVSLSSTVSQIMSSGSVAARNCWKSVVYLDCS